jgi:hypothetical protein
VWAARAPEEVNGVPTVTLNAQVPLKPEAIQVGVVGPAAQEEELRGTLRSVLASLDGETNWLTRRERAERFGQAAAQLTGVVGVGDGRSLWTSPPVKFPEKTQDCAVDVGDVDVLELRLGDNSPESSDSRSKGLVPEKLLVGKAFSRYSPLDRLGTVP